ncbi:MAG: hypothetical protein JWM68_38 [Verrucomicrobiales bacterium]|nr:hypothetical protein [Verrucomicrobiales bacterium]
MVIFSLSGCQNETHGPFSDSWKKEFSLPDDFPALGKRNSVFRGSSGLLENANQTAGRISGSWKS